MNALVFIPKFEKESEIQRLNNFPIERTDSTDRKANLGIVHGELIKDLKNGVPYDAKSSQAKRLLLSLTTLEGQHECDQ